MGLLAKLGRAVDEGPPWTPASARGEGRAARIRRAAHRAMLMRYRPAIRPFIRLLKAIAWPVRSAPRSLRYARMRGQGLAEAVAIWNCAMREGVPPLEQYAYRIDPRRPGDGLAWLYHGELMHLGRALADPAAVDLCARKQAFAAHLAARGLPVIETLLRVAPGERAELPRPAGGIVVKPDTAHAAAGLEIWVPSDDRGRRLWLRRDTRPERTDDAGLSRRVADLAARHGPMLVQPLIPPHPELVRPGAMIGPSLRLITAQWPDGRVEPATALLWQQFEEVGVAHPLGIGAPDLSTGRMRPTVAQNTPVFGWMGPSRLARELDRPLPGWEAALDAAAAAHRALPGRVPMLAWDILLSPAGPVLVEANVGASLYFHQLVTLTPGTQTPLGAALDAWLAKG